MSEPTDDHDLLRGLRGTLAVRRALQPIRKNNEIAASLYRSMTAAAQQLIATARQRAATVAKATYDSTREL